MSTFGRVYAFPEFAQGGFHLARRGGPFFFPLPGKLLLHFFVFWQFFRPPAEVNDDYLFRLICPFVFFSQIATAFLLFFASNWIVSYLPLNLPSLENGIGSEYLV